MKLSEAVAIRLKELCAAKDTTLYDISLQAGVPNSTLYNMANGERSNPKLLNLKKACDALDISVRDFFAADYFSDLESDIDDD